MTQKNLTNEKLPFIGDIEETLFKAFLQDRKMWVDFAEHIIPEYFNHSEHGLIFKIFKVFFNKYKEFPTKQQCLNIATKKQYSDETLKRIQTIYSKADLKKTEVEFLYDECAEFIKNNKIKNAILTSVQLLEDKKFIEIESEIKTATSWNNKIELGTNYADAEERFTKLAELSQNVTKSPWHAINLLSGGGAFAKELVLVASSSSVGKSIFLDNWANYVWRTMKKNVLMVTLEISEVRKAQRMDAELHEINSSEVLEYKDEIIKYFQENPLSNQLRIKEFPTSGINVNHLKQYLYQLQLYTGFIPDVIFVDYLDIMNPTKKTHDDYVDQGNVGAELRGMAIELNVPIISASQLNRGARGLSVDELGEEHLADSWRKMMIADTLILIANTQEQRIQGKLGYKIVKARNGVKDQIGMLNVDYPKLKIYDLAKKTNAKK